jgi:hypothetical protein
MRISIRGIVSEPLIIRFNRQKAPLPTSRPIVTNLVMSGPDYFRITGNSGASPNRRPGVQVGAAYRGGSPLNSVCLTESYDPVHCGTHR